MGAMGYNCAKITMAELRSIYEFEKKEEFENAVEGLKYHIGGYSANSTWD